MMAEGTEGADDNIGDMLMNEHQTNMIVPENWVRGSKTSTVGKKKVKKRSLSGEKEKGFIALWQQPLS